LKRGPFAIQLFYKNKDGEFYLSIGEQAKIVPEKPSFFAIYED
jgi:hypothetical protein